jgi:hypothetical protein
MRFLMYKLFSGAMGDGWGLLWQIRQTSGPAPLLASGLLDDGLALDLDLWITGAVNGRLKRVINAKA